MIAAADADASTVKFARVLGPYMVIVPSAVALHFNTWMKTLFNMFVADAMWQWFFGALLVFIGVFVLANHRSWRGAAAIIISVFGWVALVRGLTILFVPHAYVAAGNTLEQGGMVSAGTRLFFVLLAVGGFYLTYVGWVAKPAHNSKRASSAARPAAG